MQTTTNTNRNDNQSDYITRTVRTKDGETVIIERVQRPVRLNGFEL